MGSFAILVKVGDYHQNTTALVESYAIFILEMLPVCRIMKVFDAWHQITNTAN